MSRAGRSGVAVGLLLLGACGAGSGPTGGPSTPTADPDFTMLRASGRTIANESGQAVRLRGLNLGGWLVKEGYILRFPGKDLDAPSEIDRAIVDVAGPETGPALLDQWREQWIAEPDLAEIRALGFNSVRLPLHYAPLWDLVRGVPRPEGFAFLDRVVEWCERHRLWLFFDLHCAPGGQNAGNISDSDGVARLFTDPANQDATEALWETIAARYRDRAAVGGYDLLNEPVWDRGEDVARLFEWITRAVRRADGRHLVAVEGNTWASDFSIFGAPFGGGLLYSFHKYWNATDEASIRPYVAYSERWNVPLWLGETGENSNPWYRETLDRLLRGQGPPADARRGRRGRPRDARSGKSRPLPQERGGDPDPAGVLSRDVAGTCLTFPAGRDTPTTAAGAEAMKRASVCAALLLVLSASTLGTPQEAPPTPVFGARADLVLLDLVVRDRDGRLVDDLRADEVRVLEDGKPCAIQSFRLVQVEAGPARRAGASLEPAPSGVVPAPAEPGPAASAGDGLVSVVTLVFDQLGLEAARNSRAAALRLAGRSFPKGSVFAVFKIGQGLRVLQSFTEDRALLPPAIEKATTGVGQARDPASRPEYDNATEEAFAAARQAQAATGVSAAFLAMEARMLRLSDRMTRESQGRASLQPLLAIARGLALVQGRKSLLYFSEGFTVPPAVEEAFRATVSAANRSNVAVYAFDARGLRVRSPLEETKQALGLAADASSGEQGGGSGLEGVLAPDTAADALRLNRQGVLRDLAESTGGFLVAETNDLRPGLERVVSDLRSYYEAGYAPPNPKADGRWRAISVKVSRPGVVVRTRRGYYALPPGSPAVLPYELPLAEALAAAPMPRDVEHRAATLRFAGGEAETETLVWVEVPLGGLTLARDETTYRGHVSLFGQVKDEKGALVARLSHDAPIEGPLAERESARERTAVVRRTLRLPPGRYVLETAVQDRESGRVGARRAAFEIPAPGPAVSLGSVVIVRADDVGTAAPAPEDPLRVGRLQATPLLGRSFPEGTPAVSLLLSLHAGPSPTPPEVEIELRRDGQAVARAKPELPGPDAGGRITYVGSFPTAGLAPARYEIWVRGRRGEAGTTEATAFTIAARPSLAASEPTHSATPDSPHAVLAAPPQGPRAIEDRKGATTPLITILERAGEYVRRYEETFRNLVADEFYRQWGPDPAGEEGQVVARTLRSDLVFVRIPGPLPWATFRDVYEVDGQKVRDRERRLEKLFFAQRASDFAQAQAILDESSRYNLGPAYRNVNVPTLGLLFLRPENQRRLAFKRKGTRTIAGFPAVEVAFEEKASPTLVHNQWGNDVPASGRFWIDATRGTVLRTEIEYDLETGKSVRCADAWAWARGVVSTEYRRELALECFVPDKMTELYNFRGAGRIESVARYAGYRRFEVSIGTTEVLPLDYGPEVVDPEKAGSPPPEPPPDLSP